MFDLLPFDLAGAVMTAVEPVLCFEGSFGRE